MGEAAVVEQPSEAHPQEEDHCAPVRYCYPEFTGPGGERYMKKVLRQILPMALYRTWEIFVDHQAKGNECYLSVSQLAILAGRSLRTMQKNLASLQAKGLLVERVGWKTFRGSEGNVLSRLVIIKDFTALYALAHEYYEWLHSTETVPPERAFVPAIAQNPELVAKLRRFDNYRRLLYNQMSGRGKEEREEDRWFTDYPPAMPVQESMNQEEAMQAFVDHAFASKMTSEMSPKERSEGTPKRINESSNKHDSKGDSHDSASSFSQNSWRKGGTDAPVLSDQPIAPQQSVTQKKESRGVRQPVMRLPAGAWSKQFSLPDQQTDVREHTTQGWQRPMVRPGMTVGHHPPSLRLQDYLAPNGSFLPPQPPDHPLARSFLQEIATPFGDRNLKGSITRILCIIANASLEEAEVLLCLVRAATIARQTRTLRAAHYDQQTGQANRMPLFCTLFERFAQARVHNGTWKYSWQQMEEDLAADDRLLLWWTEHQTHLTPKSSELSGAPLHRVSDPPADQGEEEGASPPRGWIRRESAHDWGEQLLEALQASGYEAEVRVHLEDQWYQLVLIGEDGQWVLETPKQVQLVIEQLSRQEA